MDENINAVMIADCHPIYRAGMRSMLAHNFGFSNILESSSFTQLVLALNENRAVHLLFVSLDLPDMKGASGIRQLRELFPHSRLIIVAEGSNRASILDTLSAGAHGYVLTTMTDEELTDAIKVVLSRHIYVPALLAECAIEEGRTAPGSIDELTPRQREVLEEMARGKSNKQIARALDIAESTVKVHLNAAFHILCVHNRVSATVALHDLTSFSDAQPGLPGLLGERRGS